MRLHGVLDLRAPRAHRTAVLAFALYLVVLAGVAFLPLPGTPRPGTVGVVALDLSLTRPDLLGGWEAQRNVLMTVPFGVLLPLVVRWRYELLVLACVVVTSVIETGQLLVSLAVGWAWRAFDVDDLLNNTVGALLGLALTGAVLAWQDRRRSRADRVGQGRLTALRLVPGALAALLVVGAIASTLTAPAAEVPTDACAEPAVGASTRLPGDVSAYASADGSLCLLGPGEGSSSVPADTPPGVVSEVQHDGGGGWRVGVTTAGAAAVDGAQPVQGSELLVWSQPLP